MREIKFRARCSYGHEEWVFGHLSRKWDNWFITDEEGNATLIDPKTIGQYTGLKDKNGKWIYEGDVLQFSEGQTLIVHYNESTASFGVNYILHRDEYGQLVGGWIGGTRLDKQTIECEGVITIGNAYENPELLTKLADFVLKKYYPHVLGDAK